MADTSRHLYEIEVALAKYDRFNYIKNIVAFNVNGWGGKLPIGTCKIWSYAECYVKEKTY